MPRNYFVIYCILTSFTWIKVNGQAKTDALLKEMLANKSDLLDKVLQHPEIYRCQVIYTEIDRDKKNKPFFKNYYYNFDTLLYFNPASTVKLPLALLALEKLHTINLPAVNKYTPVQYDSSYPGQVKSYHDSTSGNGYPSIAHYIKKAFLISDNDAYNRLYQFTGQNQINRNLQAKGYNNIRITRQFMGNDADQNRHTNQVRFINEKGGLLYLQPPAFNTDSFDFSHIVKLGKGYLNRNDSLINEPIDFTTHNNLSVEDLQQLLQSVLFPGSMPATKRFNFSEGDRKFLLRYLSQFPSETSFPKYDSAVYYDSYVKFFMRDSTHHLPEHIRIFNKVGWAYGFLTDVSYIADYKNNIDFMLTATVYVNSDGILNDNSYDYDTIGYPFLNALGKTVYQYELKRTRSNQPALKKYRITYDHRDPKDNRISIKNADN